MRQGDWQTATACLEQHLQLVQQLGDYQSEIAAWAKMAEVAASQVVVVDNDQRVDTRVKAHGRMAAGRGKGRGLEGARGLKNDAVKRSLTCFDRAASLAKAHGEVGGGATYVCCKKVENSHHVVTDRLKVTAT